MIYNRIIHIKMYMYNPLYFICIQNLIKIKIIRLDIFSNRYIVNIINFVILKCLISTGVI